MTRIPTSHVLRDSKGTGAVELAVVLPLLLTLILGMVDVSRFVAARLDAEQAAQRATDYALALRPESDNGTYIRNEAAAAAGVPASKVAVDIYLECDTVRQDSFNNTCAAGEDRARFVSVTIDRDLDLIFDWAALGNMFGRSSAMGPSITVRGDSLVRFQ
jgi:Flp pilus assembly protein TadG